MSDSSRNEPSRTGLGFHEAIETILANVSALPSEEVALRGALGRALSRSVVSPIDLPLWDNSGMDGYAVRRADVLGASAANPVSLPVVGTIFAGSEVDTRVDANTAVRIMTGAPMPPGADAVIRVEDTDRGEQRVSIVADRDAKGSGNVREKGQDLRTGATVFEAGTTIMPVHLGVLASVGAATVHVHRAPRVVVVSTGDELVHVEQFDQVQAGRRIVSSSTYALPAWLERAGAQVRALPILPDDPDVIRGALEGALSAGCDLLITTGGVSVGTHDFTRDALASLGADMHFWRARIRPGGPIGVGRVRNTPWLGLPGNPVSTMVTAEVFARPLIRKLGGHAHVHRAKVKVRLAEPVKTGAALTHLLRVVVTHDDDGELVAKVAGAQGSNLLHNMAMANALLIVPEGQDGANAGDRLDALLYGELQ